jgi:hypothetical protein
VAPAAPGSFVDIAGSVTWLAAIPLPPDAVLIVRIQDVSRADAPALTLAEQRIELAGQPLPIRFKLTIDRDLIAKERADHRRRPHRAQGQAAVHQRLHPSRLHRRPAAPGRHPAGAGRRRQGLADRGGCAGSKPGAAAPCDSSPSESDWYPAVFLPHHPLWLVGFRPFFALACLAGLSLPIVWILIFKGVMPAPAQRLSPVQWHAHEMFFGFGWAVLGGFLLTASKNWVGVRGYHGTTLMLLAAAWLFERLGMSFGGGWPRPAVPAEQQPFPVQASSSCCSPR